ncbi:MAG: hypothetical protein FWB72_04375 [Firmicutes bacterium]|nr:hypothetical protein [Bacillota bacterium]
MKEVVNVQIDGQVLQLKNLSKVLDSTSNTTRAQVIQYYASVQNLILPHLKNRPFTQIVFTDGVGGASFYKKVPPKNPPTFLALADLPSKSKGSASWALVNNLASITYMVTLGCIEMHTWLSCVKAPKNPTYAAIDLDPNGTTSFKDTILIANAFRVLLNKLAIHSVPKTSGKRGIHIMLPIKDTGFDDVQKFLYRLSQVVANKYPDKATLNRSVNARGNRIYLDTLQNAYGKTIAAPYSLRATPNLTISMPLKWDDIKEGLDPTAFNISTFKNAITNGKGLTHLRESDPLKNFYDKAKPITNLL